MKNIFVIVSCCAVIILFNSCHKPPTEPNGYKYPMQMSWTFDTLAYPESMQTYMKQLWASSPTNIYVVGDNDRPGPGTMFQLINNQWNTTKFHSSEGGPVMGPVSLNSIAGFSKDIWVVGEHIFDNPNKPPNFLDSSLIVHFNGSIWQEYKVEGGRELNSVWEGSPDNVWTCGREGTLFHFNGLRWDRDSIPFAPTYGWEYNLMDITGNSSGDIFLTGSINDNSSGTRIDYLFHKNREESWKLIDSSVASTSVNIDRYGIFSLWTSPSGKMYSCDGNVFRYNGICWDRIYSGTVVFCGMFGTGDDNIFAVGFFGKVIHYDGVEWKTISALSSQNNNWTSGWTDGKEIFIVGTIADGYTVKTIIAHGK